MLPLINTPDMSNAYLEVHSPSLVMGNIIIDTRLENKKSL